MASKTTKRELANLVSQGIRTGEVNLKDGMDIVAIVAGHEFFFEEADIHGLYDYASRGNVRRIPWLIVQAIWEMYNSSDTGESLKAREIINHLHGTMKRPTTPTFLNGLVVGFFNCENNAKKD